MRSDCLWFFGVFFFFLPNAKNEGYHVKLSSDMFRTKGYIVM